MNANNISIHPGVVEGKRKFPLEINTKPHKGKGKLAKKMSNLAARRLDHSATLSNIRNKNSNTNPNAFKAPGSMK